MRIADIARVREEIERLTGTLGELTDSGRRGRYNGEEIFLGPGKLTGAVRRASLDLTRALAKLRAR